MIQIYPSLISSDLMNIGRTLKALDDHVAGYHLDVMDDHFVPNLTWGPSFINQIAQSTIKPLHVHLMVTNPHAWVDRLLLSDKDTFMIHWESLSSLNDAKILLKKVRDKSWRVGMVINPKTPVSVLQPLLLLLDDVLIMTVEPGFSGQAFIDVLDKVDTLRNMIKEQNISCNIGIDGGVTLDNIQKIVHRGVDFVGVASAIFSQENYVDAVRKFYQKVI